MLDSKTELRLAIVKSKEHALSIFRATCNTAIGPEQAMSEIQQSTYNGIFSKDSLNARPIISLLLTSIKAASKGECPLFSKSEIEAACSVLCHEWAFEYVETDEYKKAVEEYRYNFIKSESERIEREKKEIAERAAEIEQRAKELEQKQSREADLLRLDIERLKEENAALLRNREEGPMDVRLVDLDISVRALNCLKAASLVTVGDLSRCSWKEIAKFRNIGNRTIAELKQLTAERGIVLRDK
jgi:hypothetical protein